VTGGGADARGYGYGWFVGAGAGHAWFHHSADNAGFIAFDACLPGPDCRLVLLSNADGYDPAAITELITAGLG
jgi:hypothetical protein